MKNDRCFFVIVTVLTVALFLSAVSAVPIKNTEAVDNKVPLLLKRAQDKLDSNEAVKEKYPQIYEAITSGKILTYPIFCLATLPIVIWVFLANIEYPAFVSAVVSFWCTICIEDYEPGV